MIRWGNISLRVVLVRVRVGKDGKIERGFSQFFGPRDWDGEGGRRAVWVLYDRSSGGFGEGIKMIDPQAN